MQKDRQQSDYILPKLFLIMLGQQHAQQGQVHKFTNHKSIVPDGTVVNT